MACFCRTAGRVSQPGSRHPQLAVRPVPGSGAPHAAHHTHLRLHLLKDTGFLVAVMSHC